MDLTEFQNLDAPHNPKVVGSNPAPATKIGTFRIRKVPISLRFGVFSELFGGFLHLQNHPEMPLTQTVTQMRIGRSGQSGRKRGFLVVAKYNF